MTKPEKYHQDTNTDPTHIIRFGWRVSIDGTRWKKAIYYRSGGIGVPIVLWWNGGRWMAWIDGIMKAEPTEFKDFSDPPCQWAEQLMDFYEA